MQKINYFFFANTSLNLQQKIYFFIKLTPLVNLFIYRYYNYKRFNLPELIKPSVILHTKNALYYYYGDALNNKILKRGPRELGPYAALKCFRLMKYLNIKKPITALNQNYHLYLYKFLWIFLEKLFCAPIFLNLKKGSNAIVLKKISRRWFHFRFFKKFLKIDRRIIGILYYSLLLKDSSIFTNFLKTSFESSSIKNHKKILHGLKKLFRDLFKPVFNLLGVKGLFLNIKGKLGVTGNAKKRRFFFYMGLHSLTARSLKMDCKFTTISTPTGVLGVHFTIFF